MIKNIMAMTMGFSKKTGSIFSPFLSPAISIALCFGLIACDGSASIDTAPDENKFPEITSSADVSVAENGLNVTNVTAIDADGDSLEYGIIGGDDMLRFIINSTSGALSFLLSPDFEVPLDVNGDNDYVVEVSVSDGVNVSRQLITVRVTDIDETVNSAPQITSLATATVAENTTSIITVTATDADGDTLTFGINGGVDRLRFEINAISGVLQFNPAPDFEVPLDSGPDNNYIVQVSVDDGQSSRNQLITVTVSNVNDNSPMFTSAAGISVNENTTGAMTIAATDVDGDTLTYTLNVGFDRLLFTIDGSSGALSFNTPPDFENPLDSGGDNVYQVEVNVSDGSNSLNQLINITVNNLAEGGFGLPTRPSNTSCIIADAPVLASAIKLTQVFSSLATFNKPTVLLQSPVETDRWYVAEQTSGLIKTFLSGDSAFVEFANLRSLISTSGNEMGLLGVAFHPNFASNRYVFVYYSAPKNSGGSSVNHQSVIERYTAVPDANNVLVLDLTSNVEFIRIDQPFSNHNGGNMIFGVDGYLYIGMGDGGSGNDPLDKSQDISSYLGKMLRIDVDTPDVNKGNNYSSPLDNPFAGLDGGGAEIAGLDEVYALGLRNPWRWSFDRVNNGLILADVGQSAREEVNIITNAGNYGWPCFEGSLSGDNSTTICDVQSSYTGPIYEYNWTSSTKSITGGFVYRGSAIPALYGTYIYSDFFPGPIWGLTDPGGGSQLNSVLLQDSIANNTAVSSFAEDANGELYVVSFFDGKIYRIDPGSDVTGSFPTQLSETGCIDTANPLQMASGLVPYEINAPFWSDGAIKDRWMALPNGATITIEADDDWTFPVNSVLVKNFNLNGKRVETRLLVRHADGNWGGYSYEWNAAETDATLLLNGKTTTKGSQTYIYPGSAECFQCHTNVTNFVLGPETRQLNKDHTYLSTGITANQLLTLDSIGYFTSPLADVPANLVTLTDPADTSATQRDRARAYLYTNCSQCHRINGPTNVSLEFDITTADSAMNICNLAPQHGIGGANFIMSPGNPPDSSMYLRMTCRDGVGNCADADKMPPLGSVLVDPGSQVVAAWIMGLSQCP